MNENIELRDIPGFEGRYAATSCGKIWSYKYKKFLQPCGEENNYQIVMLWDNGKGRCFYVHRLVAMAWLPNPDNLPEVNHIDEHKDNNRLSNLEWCTKEYNLNYGGRSMRIKKPVRCIETGEVYNSIYLASKASGGAQPNLSTHLKWGTPKTVAGYHWEYVK